MMSKLSILMLFLASRDAISLLPSAPPSSLSARQLSSPPININPSGSTGWSSQGCPNSARRQRWRRRRTRTMGALYYACRPSSATLPSFSFEPAATNRSPPPPPLGSDDEESSLPCVPTLDADGPLPPGAYMRRTSSPSDLVIPSEEVKPTCKICVALASLRSDEAENGDSNINSDFDAPTQVRGMHKFIDCGLTSFQLPCVVEDASRSSTSGLDEVLYRQFLQQTPQSVRDRVKVTIPVPLSNIHSTKSARTVVMDLLMRYRTDCLDEVQLVFDKRDEYSKSSIKMSEDNSPRNGRLDENRRRRRPGRTDPLSPSHLLRRGEEYWLDALDALCDVQREGYVRSVSTRTVPNDALWLAERCNFANIIGNDVTDASLLWKPGARTKPCSGNEPPQPVPDFDEYEGAIPTTRLPTIASSPLASGLLTDRFLGCRFPTQVPNASEREQRQRKRHFHILRDYATRRHSVNADSEGLVSEAVAWDEYQKLLESVRQISRGYVGSDTASVSLRWLLQQQQLQSSMDRRAGGAKPPLSVPNVAGLVVSTRFYNPMEEGDVQEQLARRIKDLRRVFTFGLSNEEMEHLNELCCWCTDHDGLGKEFTSDRTSGTVTRFL